MQHLQNLSCQKSRQTNKLDLHLLHSRTCVPRVNGHRAPYLMHAACLESVPEQGGELFVWTQVLL